MRSNSIISKVSLCVFLSLTSGALAKAGEWVVNSESVRVYKSEEPVSGRIFSEGCGKQLLKLGTKVKDFPFYVGVSCKKEKESALVTLSFPAGVDVVNSSVFELKGKGEPWRVYEFQNIQAASGKLATFDLEYKDKTYRFILIGTRNKESKKSEEIQRGRIDIGLGYTQLTINGSDFSGNDGQPLISLSIPTYLIWGNLGVGLDAESTMAVSKGPTSITHLQLQAYTSYLFELGSSFQFEPRAYFVSTQFQTPAGRGIAFSANQIGVGAQFALRILEQSWFLVEAFIIPTGAPVIKSHYYGQISWRRKMSLVDNWSYAIGARIQSYSTQSSLGTDRILSETAAYAAVLF